MPVVLRPAAQHDLLAARDWYDAQDAGLGARFSAAAERTLRTIEANPQLFAVRKRNVRAAKLKKYPYLVYYRILNDHVEVLAVLHVRRSPRTWQARI